MIPTDEQQAALDLAASGRPLVLEAMAGTGKSSTLRMIAQAHPHKRILYTAFSAAVIADAKAGGFGAARIQSNHSLAFASHGKPYMTAGRMERRLTPRVVQEVLGGGKSKGGRGKKERAELVAHLGLETVLRFQQSASETITREHVRLPGSVDGDDAADVEHAALAMAETIWDAMCDPKSKLPVTHDTYLKRWALTHPRLQHDIILLDEAQDANPVIVDVLARQDAQLIVVGDPHQQIFSWRGAVNAMEMFQIQDHAALTRSFRFGPAVADAANAVLAAHANSKHFVRGHQGTADSVEVVQSSERHTIIARTNAALIGQIAAFKGCRIAVVGGVGDLVKLVEGAEKLQAGETPLGCPDLIDFRDWTEVEQYARTDSGKDLAVLVGLVNKHGTRALGRLLDSVRGNEREEDRCDVVLTTAHKSKGREWDRVVLLDDFPEPEDWQLPHLGPPPPGVRKKSKWNPEEANLLYVAATRARRMLDTSGCPAWHDAYERCEERGLTWPEKGMAAALAPEAESQAEQPPQDAIVSVSALEAAYRAVMQAKRCLDDVYAQLGVRPPVE